MSSIAALFFVVCAPAATLTVAAASDLTKLEPELAAALVESWKDVDEIFDRFNGRPPCAGVIPLAEMFGSAA